MKCHKVWINLLRASSIAFSLMGFCTGCDKESAKATSITLRTDPPTGNATKAAASELKPKPPTRAADVSIAPTTPVDETKRLQEEVARYSAELRKIYGHLTPAPEPAESKNTNTSGTDSVTKTAKPANPGAVGNDRKTRRP